MFMPLFNKVAVNLQVSASCVSFTASLLMASMIARPENGGLSSPFRRIILGLALSDMLQSFALIIGPWSVPKIEGSWGQGNQSTCRITGLFLSLGSGAVPMYTCFLCWYYLCKLKMRMTNRAFSRKSEWKIHSFIIGYNLLLGIAALGTNALHTTPTASFCTFASVPLGCRISPETVGECDPYSDKVAQLFFYILVAVMFVCICGIFFIMGCLVHYTHTINLHSRLERQDRQSRQTVPPRNIASDGDGGDNDNANDIGNVDVEENEAIENAVQSRNQLPETYRNQMMIQASCYVGALFLTYTGIFICFFFEDRALAIVTNRYLFCVNSTIYPLGGLFNILVYTRPAVAVLRRRYPEFSRFRALLLVIKAGGEVPEDDLGRLWCCIRRDAGETAAEGNMTREANSVELPSRSSSLINSVEGIDGESESLHENEEQEVSRRYMRRRPKLSVIPEVDSALYESNGSEEGNFPNIGENHELSSSQQDNGGDLHPSSRLVTHSNTNAGASNYDDIWDQAFERARNMQYG